MKSREKQRKAEKSREKQRKAEKSREMGYKMGQFAAKYRRTVPNKSRDESRFYFFFEVGWECLSVWGAPSNLVTQVPIVHRDAIGRYAKQTPHIPKEDPRTRGSMCPKVTDRSVPGCSLGRMVYLATQVPIRPRVGIGICLYVSQTDEKQTSTPPIQYSQTFTRIEKLQVMKAEEEQMKSR